MEAGVTQDPRRLNGGMALKGWILCHGQSGSWRRRADFRGVIRPAALRWVSDKPAKWLSSISGKADQRHSFRVARDPGATTCCH